MDQLFPTPRGNLLALAVIGAGVAASVAIYALQAFWLTGIFLMMLAAPLWINFTVHGTMAMLTGLALGGQIPRAWGLLPLVFYVGGFVIHLESGRMAHDHKSAVLARNAQATLPGIKPVTIYGDGQNLMSWYDVERVVLDSGDGEHAVRWVLQGPVCEGESGFYYDRRFAPHVLSGHLFGRHASAPDLCLANVAVRDRDMPVWPGYRIETSRDRGKAAPSPFIALTETSFVLREVGGTTAGPVTITDGFASFSAPIPLFIAGCALDSGAAKWRCFTGLWRPVNVFYYKGSGSYGMGDLTGYEKELGRVMGLKPRTGGRTSLNPS